MCDMVLKLKKKNWTETKKWLREDQTEAVIEHTGTRIKNVPLSLTSTIPTVKPAFPSSTEK